MDQTIQYMSMETNIDLQWQLLRSAKMYGLVDLECI